MAEVGLDDVRVGGHFCRGPEGDHLSARHAQDLGAQAGQIGDFVAHDHERRALLVAFEDALAHQFLHAGVHAAKGSSISTTEGSVMSARTNSKSFCWPPESSLAGMSPWSSSHTKASSSSAFWR